MSVTKTESIKSFLVAKTHKDLADLYCHDMETQITVAKDGGERIEGDYKGRQWHGYTDGIQVWKPIRIPLFANTSPEFTDSPMTFDLASHADGIGMTGWDWKSKLSRWVAFDFDAITGHSEKHSKKLTDEELSNIRTLLWDIPYVTVRKSTGGRGLHIYVFLEPIETSNHNEHASVARAILSQLSGIAHFDFSIKVDTCGGNMWVWHRKMAETNGEGLKILKSGTALAKVPTNWRDYTSVVQGRRPKNLPRFIEDQAPQNSDIESVFMELTGQRIRNKIEPDHKLVMDWLTSNYPSAVWWDAEHHMLVTHTVLLKECHTALKLRGPFETNASGTEKGFDHNVFMFPISKGAWSVRRYSLGAAEHPYWKQDGSGWTSCFYNREPNLEQAAAVYGGLEDPSGGYHFQVAENAQKAAKLLGVDIELPNWILGRETRLKGKTGGKLIVEIDKDSNSPHINGWIVKGKKATRVYYMKNTPTPSHETETAQLDDQIRHLVTENGDDCGWVVKTGDRWNTEPYQNVKNVLSLQGHGDGAVKSILGKRVLECWTLVNLPFREEYPRDRQWNRFAAKLKYKPSLNKDTLNYPTWLKILSHIGCNLDDAVRGNEWCRNNNIQKGSDWLKCWIASLFQSPMEPLPYLFLYGPQDSGKSILHEALALLMTKGICRADQALISQAGFNGELEGCVLGVVEETDLKKNLTAYNRIKDWVTSKLLPIHRKMKQPYSIPNTLHFIQCANSHLNCPVFPGDTRITMILVDSLDPKELIPKRDLIPMLEAEAADFLAEILSLEIPKSSDRLNIPCIATEDKLSAEYANQTLLETFVAEKCFYAPGHKVKFSEFAERFHEWIDPNLVQQWSKIRIGREIPPRFVKARIPQTGEFWIGNMSFTEVPKEQWMLKFISKDGKLFQVEIHHEPSTNGQLPIEKREEVNIQT